MKHILLCALCVVCGSIHAVHRYSDVVCFGAKDVRTTNLDHMALEGLKLTSFYAQPILQFK